MKTVQIPPRGESIIFINFNENDESHPLKKKKSKNTHTQKKPRFHVGLGALSVASCWRFIRTFNNACNKINFYLKPKSGKSN